VRYDSMVVVFGCAADKDAAGMLHNIALGADKIIFTRAEGSLRAMDPKDLVRKFAEVSGRMAQYYPTLKEALNKAAQAVQRDDLILVTGSFAVAGEAKRLLQEKARKAEHLPLPPAPKPQGVCDLREVKELKASPPIDKIYEVKPPPVTPRHGAVKEPDGTPGSDDKDKNKGKDSH